MKLRSGLHVTYCSNIHPGETWKEVQENLSRYLPAVKARVCPDRPFGVGLRLSAQAAATLAQPAELAVFRRFLAAHELYVFTLNGFPYGDFHGKPVKERVYRPDWLEDERLHYSNQLAWILAELLPENMVGTVSTLPVAFGSRVCSNVDVSAAAERVCNHAEELYKIHQQTGRKVVLALEPEPFCHLSTVDETIAFFQRLGQSPNAARVRQYVGVCFDACHMAVEQEEPQHALERLAAAGIQVTKVQISAGLEVGAHVDAKTHARLSSFADPVYLHQTIEMGRQRRWLDLAGALPSIAAGETMGVRIHFHVPLFFHDLGGFFTTQPYVRELLAALKNGPIAPHLEVETYTWEVLPKEYRDVPVEEAIQRELDWVTHCLA